MSRRITSSARVDGSFVEEVVVARFSEAEKTLIWDWWQQGGSMRGVARELGRAHASVRWMVESYGGVRPSPRFRASRHLTLEEREEISRGVASGESLRSVASRLGRLVSTVSREVARNGGRLKYRAMRADQAAFRRARRPKVCKLAANPTLALMVEEKLGPVVVAGADLRMVERVIP
jgi:IS30 family transposase